MCETLDKRFFRFLEHFPDVPISKMERKGGCLFGDGQEDCIHDDVASTPALMISRLVKQKREEGERPFKKMD